MPFSAVLSLVLIIGYIYPSWFGEDAGSIKNIKKEIKKESEELAEIKTKKSNIIKLSQSLSDNAEMESLINKYYPTYRNDEDVVNNINNIAFNEGVFLVNMGINYKKMESADSPSRIMALPLQVDETNPSASADGISANPGFDENGNSLEEAAKSKIKFIEASLEIEGNYDQIKRFLTSLNKVGLLNNVQYFKIYKKEKQDTVSEEDEVATDLLTADVIVGFGYLISSSKEIGSLLNSELFGRSEFNLSEIESSKSILTGNYKRSEVGEVGVANPFLKEDVAVQ